MFPSNIKIETRYHYLRVKENLLTAPANAVIYHKGGVSSTRDDTDVELDFRQESNFLYLSGVESAGFHILIVLETDKIYLVKPTINPSEQLWKGIPDTDEQLLEKYDADAILSESQVPELLDILNPPTIYTLDITDTSIIPSHLSQFVDETCLKAAIHESRLTKFPWEISLLRYAAHISSHAHMALMTHSKKQRQINEAELEARFRWVCGKNGLSRQCYIPIIASGRNAAVLHYTDNNKFVPKTRHTLVLVDAGGEYRCYGSDVTRTYPILGKFSDEAKTIYNIVLKAQKAVLDKLKPGVYWKDMHELVVRILCSELVKIGILIGDVQELIDLGVYRAFYFHGTGHSVGIDCHDVGGKDIGILNHPLKISKERKGYPLSLFTSPLEKDMVVTVEPGLYFNDVSIDIWTNHPNYFYFFDMNKVNQYRAVGGVRIEDTVLITSTGIENFTIAPKEVVDIEALMH